jgi:hypothetical protein
MIAVPPPTPPQPAPRIALLVVIKRNGEEGKNAFKIRKAATIGR